MGVFAMTGGATGIGAAVKQQLRDAGHTVLVVDIKDADIVADLSTASGRASAVAGIREQAAQGLDGFVACAGLGPHVSPPSKVAKVNYFGTVEVVEGVRELVVKRGGSVVLISSNSAPMPGYDEGFVEALLAGDEDTAARLVDALDGQVAYGGSKLALTRWMRRQAPDWARQGVRLNAVAPGITRTPLTDQTFQDETYGQAMKDFGDSVPLGKIGRPEQIAAPVCFLLSEQADFICGSVLFVDGGHDAMFRPDQF